MASDKSVVDDHGAPLASADVDRIQAEATILGYELALTSHDPVAVDVVLRSAREEVGADHFKHVTAEALRHVTVNVIAPMIEIAQAHGLDHTDTIGFAVRNARDTLDHLRTTPQETEGATVTYLPSKSPEPQDRPYASPKPFTGEPFDLEQDSEHPPMDRYACDRRLVARNHHRFCHDQSGELDYVPVSAVLWDSIGPSIELGPWSMGLTDARDLAQSLLTLVSLVDGRTSASLIQDVPITDESTAQYLAELAEDEDRPKLRIVEDLP